MKLFTVIRKGSLHIISKSDLEDISNEGKELCVDVGKKKYREDISNEGKEP
jgi:hypothetical protein